MTAGPRGSLVWQAFLLAALLLLSSCARESAQPPEPGDLLVLPEVQDAPDEEVAPVQEDEGVIIADDVVVLSATCDGASSTLSFTLRNPTKEWVWLLDPAAKPSAFVQYKDRADPIVLLFNDYQVNGKSRPMVGGQLLFGPQEGFAANCGGVRALEPGEAVSCVFSPVKILVPTRLSRGDNVLELTGTSKYERVVVPCT
ncbi:MAG: hypothetical protein HC945_02450 [Nitrosarchaeum sp.]|nr:hypothetical protein [Nitrosarchaeum sp.]